MLIFLLNLTPHPVNYPDEIITEFSIKYIDYKNWGLVFHYDFFFLFVFSTGNKDKQYCKKI